jgi:dihydrolipoamide dehydrogenase
LLIQSGTAGAVDAAAVLARLRRVRQEWNEAQRQALLDAGVALIQGTARFSARNEVRIALEGGSEQKVVADIFIVATGSVPRFPAALRPDGERILAPRFAAALDPLPSDIVVVGGGATGSEFAYLFQTVGARVTWVIGRQGVLPTFHPAAGAFLNEVLRRRGMTVLLGQDATGIARDGDRVIVTLADESRHAAGYAFLAIGRCPDLDGLNLAAAGLNAGELPPLDSYGRSPNPRLYFVGDAAGGALMVNKGLAQARAAAYHAMGLTTPPYDAESTLFAIYTEPQVAQIGRLDGEGTATIKLPYTANLKGNLLTEPAGFIELGYQRSDGTLRGGVAVGEHAADLLAPLALAIQQRLTVNDLASIYVAHPTVSELLFSAARAAAWQKKE